MNGVQRMPARRVVVTQRGTIAPSNVPAIRAAIAAIEAGAWGEGLTVGVRGRAPGEVVIVDEYAGERPVVDELIDDLLRTGRHRELSMVVTYPARDEGVR